MVTAQITMPVLHPTGADALVEESPMSREEVPAKRCDGRKLYLTQRLTDEGADVVEVLLQHLPDDLGRSVPGGYTGGCRGVKRTQPLRHGAYARRRHGVGRHQSPERSLGGQPAHLDQVVDHHGIRRGGSRRLFLDPILFPPLPHGHDAEVDGRGQTPVEPHLFLAIVLP